jgi:mono/diheme cytochrome c family protein
MTPSSMTRCAMAALAGLAVAPLAIPAPAEDAAALYKSKCAACHGPAGAGRTAIKGSNLLTREAKEATDEELAGAIASGGKTKQAAHAFEKKGVSGQQIRELVKYIRELQQKK